VRSPLTPPPPPPPVPPWQHPTANESTPAGRQRHTACLVQSKKLFVLGGFDGFKWLHDLHVLDVGKLEESAITSASVTSLLDDLHELVNNPEMFPDVTFLVEGEPVYAHKAILCARSAHFRAMFKSGMRESREASITYGGGWSRIAFVAMMEFLYTGSVRDLSPPVAGDLMGLADHSAIDGLKTLCETALMHSVDAANVCTLLLTAHRYSASDLKRHCLDYVLRHHDLVPLHELAVEPALLLDITREVLTRKT
jgi:leucine-zipper-like transcriptional regulator 1